MSLSIKKSNNRTSEGKTEAIAEIIKEKTKKLNVLLPVTKHKSFKIKCMQNGDNMSALINKWISQYVSE
tara:strand:- start:17 stop:223 length:207 start_codon:yes stop_codon:yes gene_type:complete